MPNHSEQALVLNKQAIALVGEQRLAEAAELLQQATHLYPDVLASHQNLGAIYMMRREFRLAAQFLQHVVKVDPRSVKSHFNLANIYRELGNTPKAIRHLQIVIELEPNHHSAGHILAASTGKTPERTPAEFVKRLFDQYSCQFDSALAGELEYETPTSLASLLTSATVGNGRYDRVLDLGCGTGLAGAAFAPLGNHMTGVDLSSGMLNCARAKNIYGDLIVDDILDFLEATPLKFNLFVASDVFNYLGNLLPVFAGIKRCSSSGAHLVFSIETKTDDDFELAPTCRYRHSEQYVRRLADQFGFQILAQRNEILRQEKASPVPGTLFCLRHSQGSAHAPNPRRTPQPF